MSRQLVVAILALFLVIVGVGLTKNEAMAGCIPLASGGQFCADWLTGSEVANTIEHGIGNVCGQAHANCTAQVLAAAGGILSIGGSNPLCNATNGNFPPASAGCGFPGIAFCVNPAGNSSKANGESFTLFAVLESAQAVGAVAKNGSATQKTTLVASNTEVVCRNPNWTLQTFTATQFKAKVAFCTQPWDLTQDPPVCTNGGIQTILVELCQIDPNLINPQGGQGYTCVPLPAAH